MKMGRALSNSDWNNIFVLFLFGTKSILARDIHLGALHASKLYSKMIKCRLLK